MIQKIIIKIVTAKITNSRYCLTASPKNIRTRLTRKNLEPLPKRLTQKNFRKCIFKIPLPIVKILYGTGVKAEKNTAKDKARAKRREIDARKREMRKKKADFQKQFEAFDTKK